MKIQRSEFKSMMKECLKELIQEGALNHVFSQMFQNPQQQVTNPIFQNLGMQAAGNGNPQGAKILENIFADTAENTIPMQQRSDPSMLMGAYQNQFQQQYNNNFYQNQPMPQQQFINQPQPQQQDGGMTNWARLAFNSPISNRPGNENSSLLGGMSNPNYLPGNTIGKFG